MKIVCATKVLVSLPYQMKVNPLLRFRPDIKVTNGVTCQKFVHWSCGINCYSSSEMVQQKTVPCNAKDALGTECV